MLGVLGTLSIVAGIAFIRAGIREQLIGDYLASALRMAKPAPPVRDPSRPQPPEPRQR